MLGQLGWSPPWCSFPLLPVRDKGPQPLIKPRPASDAEITDAASDAEVCARDGRYPVATDGSGVNPIGLWPAPGPKGGGLGLAVTWPVWEAITLRAICQRRAALTAQPRGGGPCSHTPHSIRIHPENRSRCPIDPIQKTDRSNRKNLTDQTDPDGRQPLKSTRSAAGPRVLNRLAPGASRL
jgi:hypothetical protein